MGAPVTVVNWCTVLNCVGVTGIGGADVDVAFAPRGKMRAGKVSLSSSSRGFADTKARGTGVATGGRQLLSGVSDTMDWTKS